MHLCIYVNIDTFICVFINTQITLNTLKHFFRCVHVICNPKIGLHTLLMSLWGSGGWGKNAK